MSGKIRMEICSLNLKVANFETKITKWKQVWWMLYKDVEVRAPHFLCSFGTHVSPSILIAFSFHEFYRLTSCHSGLVIPQNVMQLANA